MKGPPPQTYINVNLENLNYRNEYKMFIGSKKQKVNINGKRLVASKRSSQQPTPVER